MQLTDKQKGITLAFLGVLMITPDSLFIRLVNINSWDLVFYRGAIPFLCLLTGLLFVYKNKFLSTFYAIGLAGVLNAIFIALMNISFIVSIENTNVANTLIMISLAPFTAAIMSSIFLKEHPKSRTWFAMALCFLCVIFIFYDSYEANRLFGDFFGFVTAIFVGASSVVIRYAKIVNFLPSLLLGKLFTSLIALLFIQSIYLEGIDLYLIIIMGIFLVTLPLTFLTLAPRYIAAHEVQLFFILETALGPLWVWLVIQEEPTIRTIMGGVLIILTIFVHTFFDLKDSKVN